jgi:hypothetical protein
MVVEVGAIGGAGDGEGVAVTVEVGMRVGVPTGVLVGVGRHSPSWGYCGRPGIRLTTRSWYCGISQRWICTLRVPPGRRSQIHTGVQSSPLPEGFSESVEGVCGEAGDTFREGAVEPDEGVAVAVDGEGDGVEVGDEFAGAVVVGVDVEPLVTEGVADGLGGLVGVAVGEGVEVGVVVDVGVPSSGQGPPHPKAGTAYRARARTAAGRAA